MTDYELCMLEQLTYMEGEKDVWINKFGIDISLLRNNGSLENFLDSITEDNLKKLDSMGDAYIGGDFISANEWVSMLRYMKGNQNIKSLNFVGTHENDEGYTMSMCFENPSEPGSAIVAFKGSAKNEWSDNVEGIRVTDTKAQMDAYDYIEGLSYDNITVIGHSKGGNKAMYCTIRSEKVNRCVSMDGQGFSDKFMDKYAVQISKKANKITNVSYSADFVHVLMLQIPGSNQIYTNEGSGVKSVPECHSPNSIFSFKKIEGKNMRVTGDFKECEESKSVQIIRGFTEYLIFSEYPNKKKMIVYLEKLLTDGLDGITKNLSDNPDFGSIETLLLYLIKYIREKGITAEEFYDLLVDMHVLDRSNNVIGPFIQEYLENKLDNVAYGLLKENWATKSLGNKSDLYYIEKLFSLLEDDEKDVQESIFRYLAQGAKLTYNTKTSLIKLIKDLILTPIRKKYNQIVFDDSEKWNNIKRINRLKKMSDSGLIETASLVAELLTPQLYYRLSGIERAIELMREAEAMYILDVLDPSIFSLAGSAYENVQELYNTYENLNTYICETIKATLEKTQNVLDMVNAVEGKQ